MSYFVTGATGFIGRNLVEKLLEREGEVHVLVREGSRERLDALIERWGAADRVKPVTGDLTEPLLGVSEEDREALAGVEHFLPRRDLRHDRRRDAERDAQRRRDAERRPASPTSSARASSTVSSVALAGRYKGYFTEDMFDEGQEPHTPYHRTKFESEKLVREKVQGAWRVYRPAVVVATRAPARWTRSTAPTTSSRSSRSCATRCRSGRRWSRSSGVGRTSCPSTTSPPRSTTSPTREGYDGGAFHRGPEGHRRRRAMNTFARAGHAPHAVMRVDKKLTDMLPKGVLSYAMQIPALKGVRKSALADLGIPDEILQDVAFTAKFDARDTQRALAGTGIEPPPLDSYAYKPWTTGSATRPGPVQGPLVRGRGQRPHRGHHRRLERHRPRRGAEDRRGGRHPDPRRALARQARGGQGGDRVARRHRPRLHGGPLRQRPIDAAVEQILSDHAAVDMLVNNAGRSIRRSVMLSLDRPRLRADDQAQLPRLIKLILGLLHMKERGFGHRQRLLDRRAEPAAPPPTWHPSPRWMRSRAWSRPRRSATTSPSRRSTCRSCARR